MINYYVMCCVIPEPFFRFCFVFSENISPLFHVDNSTYLSYFCKCEFKLSSISQCIFCLSLLDIVETNVCDWHHVKGRGKQEGKWNKINTSCYWWGQISLTLVQMMQMSIKWIYLDKRSRRKLVYFPWDQGESSLHHLQLQLIYFNEVILHLCGCNPEQHLVHC